MALFHEIWIENRLKRVIPHQLAARHQKMSAIVALFSRGWHRVNKPQPDALKFVLAQRIKKKIEDLLMIKQKNVSWIIGHRWFKTFNNFFFF